MNFAPETNTSLTEFVIFGCGAMAVETALYINDIDRQASAANRRFEVTDIVSTNFDRYDDIARILEYKPLCHEDIIGVSSFKEKKSVLAIGSNIAIHRLRQEVKSAGGSFGSIVHPDAYIAPTAKIGSGVIIAPYCFVGPYSSIGDNSILNIRATVGHDVRIGVGVVISPHVDINGAAKIGNNCFLGAGVTVDPLVDIGDFCKATPGTTIHNDVGAGAMVMENTSIKKVRMFNLNDGSNLFARKK